jgi:hypothetical protein
MFACKPQIPAYLCIYLPANILLSHHLTLKYYLQHYWVTQIDQVLQAARAGKAGMGRELHLAAEQRPLAESFAGLMEVCLYTIQAVLNGTDQGC